MVDWTALEVTYEESGERFVVARPSLVIALFGRDEVRAQASQILDYWLTRFGDSRPGIYGLTSRSRAFKALSDKDITKLRGELQFRKAKFFFLKDADGFDIGTTSLELSLVNDSYPAAAARAYIAMPVQSVEPSQCDSTAASAIALMNRVQPSHAFVSLGFSVVFGREYEGYALPKVFASCRRYLGFDLPERFTEQDLADKLKSAYWITYVSSRLIDTYGLGPRLSRLPSGVSAEPLQSGTVFRAGTCPPIGDRNRGATDLASLKDMYSALKPAMATRWSDSNAFGFGVEDVDGWFGRFER